MKFLVLAACVAATSASGFFGLQAHPNGAVTPLDEPAVAAAKADHLATKFGAYAPAYNYGAGYAYGAGYGYVPSLVAHPNGAVTPVDEPAVAAYDAAPVIAAAPAYAPTYAYSGPLHIP